MHYFGLMYHSGTSNIKDFSMKTLLAVLFASAMAGCGTARGIVSGVEDVGAGVIQDARAAIDGVANRDGRDGEDE